MARSDLAEHLGQQIGRHGRNDPHAHLALKRRAGARTQGHDVLHTDQQISGPGHHLLPQRGEKHFAVVPLDQAHAQRFFQLQNAGAERALTDVTSIRRVPKVLMLGHGT